MKRITIGMLLALLICVQNAQALEQDDEDITAYTFNDVLVEGTLIAPDGEFIPSRKSGRERSLIKVRTDFIKELLRQVKNI